MEIGEEDGSSFLHRADFFASWMLARISALFLSRFPREPLVSKRSFADHVKITCPLAKPRNLHSNERKNESRVER